MEGFEEEKFHSFLRGGDLATIMKHPWEEIMVLYLKAFEVCQRIEPFLRISEHYMGEKKWILASNFCRLMLELEYPHHCILFVDKGIYDYTRYHTAGRCFYYTGQYELGKKCCIRAIENSRTPEEKKVNQETLNMYYEKDKETKKYVQLFNKYDLYTKSNDLLDIEELNKYYLYLIKKYFINDVLVF